MPYQSAHPDPMSPHIAVDVMGSDYGAEQVVAGVCLAIKANADRIGKIFFVGDESAVRASLRRNKLLDSSKIECVHTSQEITMQDKPIHALKHKKEASMFRAIDLVKEGKAEAVLSCGNTGCLMAGSTLKLRPIQGIDRPALASVIPTRTHHFILIDVGANPNTTVQHLVHNAILGTHFARAILRTEQPRLGLLTIGTEEGKGNERIQQVHDYLKQFTTLNYQGLIEGFDLFSGTVDVVVCDGFVGNILLKTCESLFLNLKQFLDEEFRKTKIRKVGALLSHGVFRCMKRQFSPEKFSGAPLLGLNGWVFKSHGSSRAKAVEGAINMCLNCLESYNLQAVTSDIAFANQLLQGEEKKEEAHA